MKLRAVAALPLLLAACLNGGDASDPGDRSNPPGGDACATPLTVPTTGRALDLMPPDRLAAIAARVPCVPAGPLRDLLEATQTFWYDHGSLTSGYQDSFGDNVIAPIGFRPNTIDPQMINLAVPGGHQLLFSAIGTFHFPFGSPLGPAKNIKVVDFWRPASVGGTPLPVVYWRRDASADTHRYEWMFPAGTTFGELLFLDEGGELHPFEIRTKTRTVDGWAADVFRPFPTATDLADAIEARRAASPAWAASPALDQLVAQLRDTSTLQPYGVSATHFKKAFEARTGVVDVLPALAGADADLIHELLRTTPFRSARGVAWKQGAAGTAWAASAAGGGAIVPAGFNATAFDVNEQTCDTCHRDAGRPFRDFYPNVLAYGELWGNDEIFTWHPFKLANFVNDQGRVVNFNYDNRVIRSDLKGAGLVAPYDKAAHPDTIYRRILRDWTDFSYN